MFRFSFFALAALTLSLAVEASEPTTTKAAEVVPSPDMIWEGYMVIEEDAVHPRVAIFNKSPEGTITDSVLGGAKELAGSRVSEGLWHFNVPESRALIFDQVEIMVKADGKLEVFGHSSALPESEDARIIFQGVLSVFAGGPIDYRLAAAGDAVHGRIYALDLALPICEVKRGGNPHACDNIGMMIRHAASP